MTNTNQNLGEVIREQLESYRNKSFAPEPFEKDLKEWYKLHEHNYIKQLESAEKAILKAAEAEMLDIVEDVEFIEPSDFFSNEALKKETRNRYRQKLRQRIKERFGK